MWVEFYDTLQYLSKQHCPMSSANSLPCEDLLSLILLLERVTATDLQSPFFSQERHHTKLSKAFPSFFFSSHFPFSSITPFQSPVSSVSIGDGLVCWFRQSLSVLWSIDVYKKALNNWSQLTHEHRVDKGSFWPQSLIFKVVWDLMTLIEILPTSSKPEGKAVLEILSRC